MTTKAGEVMGKGNPHSLWECKLVHQIWKSVWDIFKNVKINLINDLANHSLAYAQRHWHLTVDTC